MPRILFPDGRSQNFKKETNGFIIAESISKSLLKKAVAISVNGLQKDGIDYRGFIFIGLMNINGNPFVIEYNVRMGDPETEVVLPRIKSDLFDLFEGVANQNLDEKSFEVNRETATTIMLVSGSYPKAYEKGKPISGLENVSNESMIFHAGTNIQN